MADRHPSTTNLLRWFEYGHLPPRLQIVSAPVGELARTMVELLPDGPELSDALRELLRAKDGFVRAAVDADLEVMTRSAAPAPVEAPARDGVTTACAVRTYRVGVDEPGRWLECAHLYSPHPRFPHRTADGEVFE